MAENKNIKKILDYHWNLIVPVRVDEICQKLGIKVSTIDINQEPNSFLICGIKNGQRFIKYRQNVSSTSIIRKLISIGLSKHVNNHIFSEEVLSYGNDVFVKNDSLTHSIDLSIFPEFLMPKEAIDVYICKEKIFEISELSKIFDVTETDMYLRLVKLKYLPS